MVSGSFPKVSILIPLHDLGQKLNIGLEGGLSLAGQAITGVRTIGEEGFGYSHIASLLERSNVHTEVPVGHLEQGL